MAVQPSLYLEHSSANNKNALFLPSNPLNDLVRALRDRLARRIRPSNAVKFEDGRFPCQRYGVVRDAVLHFQVGRTAVNAGVQGVV